MSTCDIDDLRQTITELVPVPPLDPNEYSLAREGCDVETACLG
jgi:hypothetical protein